MTSDTDYGLYKYRLSVNIGDEVQSLGAHQFLPRVDRYIERDNWAERPIDRPTKLIANGWYMDKPYQWPPKAPNVLPLFVAMHVETRSVALFTRPESLAFLGQHAPIGCRDFFTRDLLLANGVDAYFSGCMTLTLQRPEGVVPGDDVLLVDVDDGVADLLPAAWRPHVAHVTHDYDLPTRLMKKVENRTGISTMPYRLNKARGLLRRYAGARLVITSRLHCALPCIAMGAPVLYVVPTLDDPRYAGLIEHTNHCERANLAAYLKDRDWSQPFTNPDTHLPLRAALTDRCRSFIAAAG